MWTLMDPLLAELASTAGTTLAKAIATEGWQSAKDAVARLWARHAANQGPLIEANLDAAREDVDESSAQNVEQTEKTLATVWEANFKTLLRSHPEAAEDLRLVLERDLTPLIAQSTVQNIRVDQTATVGTGGFSFQVGGNYTASGPAHFGQTNNAPQGAPVLPQPRDGQSPDETGGGPTAV
jgi:hypothetical protein